MAICTLWSIFAVEVEVRTQQNAVNESTVVRDVEVIVLIIITSNFFTHKRESTRQANIMHNSLYGEQRMLNVRLMSRAE